MREAKKTDYQLMFNGTGAQGAEDMTRIKELFSNEFGLSDTAVELFLKKAPMVIKHAAKKEELIPFLEKLSAAGAEVSLIEPSSESTADDLIQEFTIELEEIEPIEKLEAEDNLTIEQLVNELESSAITLKPTHEVNSSGDYIAKTESSKEKEPDESDLAFDLHTASQAESKEIKADQISQTSELDLALSVAESAHANDQKAEPAQKSITPNNSLLEFDLSLAPVEEEAKEQTATPNTTAASIAEPSEDSDDLTISLEPAAPAATKVESNPPEIKVTKPETDIIQLETAQIEKAPGIEPPAKGVAPSLEVTIVAAAPTKATTPSSKEPTNTEDPDSIELNELNTPEQGSKRAEGNSRIESSAAPHPRNHSNLAFYLATIGSIALLGVANWIYFSEPASSSETKVDTATLLKDVTTKKAVKKATSKNKSASIETVVNYASSFDQNALPIEAAIAISANTISSLALTIYPSESPALTPREIVHGVKRKPWIGKAVIDNATFYTSSDGAMHANGIAKVTVNYDDRTFPTSADAELIAVQNGENLTAIVTLKRLIAPGEIPKETLIEPISTGGFRFYHQVKFEAAKKVIAPVEAPKASKIESTVSEEELSQLLAQ